jgi:cytochrome c553
LIPWTCVLGTIAALGVLAIIGGFVVMLSGVVSTRASAGHWAITEAFLQLGKRRSVATHAIGTKVPPLDDSSLALRGAGHYEIGCQPCHGSPALRQPRIAQHMLPPPPYLPQTVHRYEAAELFQLVKHGIKLTGMPAWPSQKRDDEVWAMVAFLRALPGMSAAEYRHLAHGPAAGPAEAEPMEQLAQDHVTPRTVTEVCSRCHGSGGTGRGVGAFPKIAGQRPAYLLSTLTAYARGQRHSGIMEPIAAGLTRDELLAIAEYYSRLAPVPAHASAPPASDLVAEGARIARDGVPERDIPACASCHGPGQPRPNPSYPVLAGQYAEYLRIQLELFKSDSRGGAAYRTVMHTVAHQLDAEHIEAVAAFYASLPWRAPE